MRSNTFIFLRAKETELLDISTLKEETAYYAGKDGHRSLRRQGSY